MSEFIFKIMEISLICEFIIAIVVSIILIIKTTVLDRWENAEKQFQKDDKIEEDNVCDSTVVSSQDQNTSVKESVIDLSLIADKGIIL